MVVVKLDPDESTLIPVDKRRFEIIFRNETESEVTLMLVPREVKPKGEPAKGNYNHDK